MTSGTKTESRAQQLRWSSLHFVAIEAEAAKHGMSASEWVKRQALRGLPKEVRDTLPPLQPKGRPRSANDANDAKDAT